MIILQSFTENERQQVLVSSSKLADCFICCGSCDNHHIHEIEHPCLADLKGFILESLIKWFKSPGEKPNHFFLGNFGDDSRSRALS
jgi:hypothetical protein